MNKRFFLAILLSSIFMAVMQQNVLSESIGTMEFWYGYDGSGSTIVDERHEAVVTFRKGDQLETETGTGNYIGKNYILTCHHVKKEMNDGDNYTDYFATFYTDYYSDPTFSNEVKYRIIGVLEEDSDLDYCILLIDGNPHEELGIQPTPIDRTEPAIGDNVVMIGYPRLEEYPLMMYHHKQVGYGQVQNKFFTIEGAKYQHKLVRFSINAGGGASGSGVLDTSWGSISSIYSYTCQSGSFPLDEQGCDKGGDAAILLSYICQQKPNSILSSQTVSFSTRWTDFSWDSEERLARLEVYDIALPLDTVRYTYTYSINRDYYNADSNTLYENWNPIEGGISWWRAPDHTRTILDETIVYTHDEPVAYRFWNATLTLNVTIDNGHTTSTRVITKDISLRTF